MVQLGETVPRAQSLSIKITLKNSFLETPQSLFLPELKVSTLATYGWASCQGLVTIQLCSTLATLG